MNKNKFLKGSLLALTLATYSPEAKAASSNWNVDANGNWATAGNWDANGIPGSTSITNSPDIANFAFTLGADRVVTVDTNRNVGGLTFGNTSNFKYTLSSGSLLLSNGGVIQTAIGNGDHTDTISSAITIQGVAGSATFTGGATSANSIMSIGAVTGVSTVGNTTTLNLNGSNTGINSVSGVIGNGAAGGNLAVVKSGSGTWRLSGTNTYTGGLTLNSGTLSLGNNAALGAAASGFVINGGVIDVNAARSITNNNAQTWNGSFAFTGANTLDMGTGAVSLGGNVTVSNTGASGLTVGGAVTGSNNLALNAGAAGGITFTNVNNTGTVTNSGTGSANVVLTTVGSNVSGIIQNSATSQLTVTNLTVNSAGTTLTNGNNSTSTKALTVTNQITGTGNLILNNNGVVPSGIVLALGGGANNVGTITNSGTGTIPAVVSNGSSTSLDVGVAINGAIGSNVTNVIQNSANSSMLLNAANAFTGNATVLAGGLALGNATAASSSTILLGNTSGSADAALWLRGVTLSAAAVANNITVRSGNTGTMTIGTSQGGSAGSTGSASLTGLITLNKNATFSMYNNSLTLSPTGGTSLTGVGGINVANGGLFTSSSGQTWGVGGASLILTTANTYQGDTKVLSGALQLTGSATALADLKGWLGSSTNDVYVGDTSGYQSARINFSPGAANQVFSRNITIQAGSGGLAGVGVIANNAFAMIGNVNFDKSGFLYTIANATSSFSGNLLKGSGSTGAVSLTDLGQGTTQITGTGNNYDGGTVVGGAGVLSATGAGALGTGNVFAELGVVRLNDQLSLASGKKVLVGSYGGVSFSANNAAYITYLAGVVDSNSTGAISIGVNVTNTINLASFGNGNMFLGADGSRTYSAATLGANADGNYRLGYGRGGSLIISSNALSGGSAKLIVGSPINSSAGTLLNTVGTVTLTGTNTYGGGTEVNTGSSLIGTQRTVGGDSPFGSATGAMALHHASLRLQNNGTSTVGTSLGAFSFDGQSSLQVDGTAGGVNTLTLASLTRNNKGVLNINSTGTLGSTALIKVAGAASTAANAKISGGVSVGMVSPYIVDGSGGNFMTYDATNGFTAITGAYTTLAGVPTDAIVKLGASAVLTADTTVYALSTGNLGLSMTITNTSGADRTLTISSGGLYHAPGATSASLTIGSTTVNQKVNLDFGGQEAVITATTSNNSSLTIVNNIANASGITKSGNSALILQGTGSTFVGDVTIFNGGTNGCVSISQDANLGGVGASLNNGVVLDGGKLQFNSFTGNLSSTRTVTIGSNGGILQTLTGGNVGALAVTIDSKITGANGSYLNLYSGITGNTSNTVSSSFTFTNTANDFVAPIFVGTAGSQGVMTLIFNADSQLGNAANSISLLGGNSALRYNGTGAITSSRNINFFEQGGAIDIADANGTFTTSGVLAGSGLFNKTGNGKMVLTGSNTYTGNTIVSAGVLNAQNANALGASTAAVSGSSGISGGGVYVQNGAALEVQGSVALGGTGGKTMYLNGNGIANGGSLRSVSGTNSNAGATVLQSNSTIGVDAGTYTASGSVSGSGSLTKVGAGTLNLSGTNTYTGATSVNVGALLVNGSISGSNVIVANGARLGGSGTLNGGSTVIQSGATHTPGNSPGVQTFANDNLTYNTGSTFQFELFSNTASLVDRGNATTGFDGIDLTGTSLLTIQSGVISELVFGGSTDFTQTFWNSNHSWLVFDTANASTLGSLNIFDTISIVNNATGSAPASTSFSFSQSGGDIYLDYSAVPEPSTYALMGMGLGALWFLRRKKKA